MEGNQGGWQGELTAVEVRGGLGRDVLFVTTWRDPNMEEQCRLQVQFITDDGKSNVWVTVSSPGSGGSPQTGEAGPAGVHWVLNCRPRCMWSWQLRAKGGFLHFFLKPFAPLNEEQVPGAP